MQDLTPFYSLKNTTIDFKEAIRRSIEKLLNTRCCFLEWPEKYKALERSVLSYGLPRFINEGLVSQQDKTTFCKQMETVISRHEPRLSDVKVTHIDADSTTTDEGKFCFTITGYISVTKQIEPFLFNSYFRQESSDFYVN